MEKEYNKYEKYINTLKIKNSDDYIIFSKNAQKFDDLIRSTLNTDNPDILPLLLKILKLKYREIFRFEEIDNDGLSFKQEIEFHADILKCFDQMTMLYMTYDPERKTHSVYLIPHKQKQNKEFLGEITNISQNLHDDFSALSYKTSLSQYEDRVNHFYESQKTYDDLVNILSNNTRLFPDDKDESIWIENYKKFLDNFKIENEQDIITFVHKSQQFDEFIKNNKKFNPSKRSVDITSNNQDKAYYFYILDLKMQETTRFIHQINNLSSHIKTELMTSIQKAWSDITTLRIDRVLTKKTTNNKIYVFLVPNQEEFQSFTPFCDNRMIILDLEVSPHFSDAWGKDHDFFIEEIKTFHDFCTKT